MSSTQPSIKSTRQESNQKCAADKIKTVDDILEPPSSEVCGSVTDSTPQELDRYNDIGLRSIANGESCVILMAGGLGTRLGVNYPKGMYNVGLPSGKSLFQLQAERLLKLQHLAKQRFDNVTPIMWYIMTSGCTRGAIVEYFTTNNYFGLSRDQVLFFEQFTLPVIGLDGRIILESKYRISQSPDGNGGLYIALRSYKIIDDMKQRGIKHVHVYGVDNILIKIADPIFFGFFIEKGAECAAKVVEKISPTENVGVVAKVGGRYRIVEYSEIDKSTSELLDPEDNSKLMYRFGSICNHMFNIGFLERVCQVNSLNFLDQHIALKKVPFVDIATGKIQSPLQINAIKLEKFVFDVFPLAESFVIWEVERNEEFSPLKNSSACKTECPETSKMSILNYHNYLVRSSLKDCHNIKKAANITFEISPLVSYSGEGLDNLDRCIGEIGEDKTVILELNEDNEVIVKEICNFVL